MFNFISFHLHGLLMDIHTWLIIYYYYCCYCNSSFISTKKWFGKFDALYFVQYVWKMSQQHKEIIQMYPWNIKTLKIRNNGFQIKVDFVKSQLEKWFATLLEKKKIRLLFWRLLFWKTNSDVVRLNSSAFTQSLNRKPNKEFWFEQSYVSFLEFHKAAEDNYWAISA